ncbi:hypothetical protein [Clostridium butyricum]|uniref:Uncharacterized protein n=1 Tax=Clostridium butyricum TaxID=1492 RepID=A0A2S7FE77_CLOBU|nr:hypothetical protein [Clostridium butyricum]KHD15607.1 hypothetical protein OA81_08860 [Clostridium butyricum]MDB2150924.1 hypothetical protein [Clostridium butyricum]PPV16990.1 hypothetical protein AWN73_09070 [Clostridium butyricum]
MVDIDGVYLFLRCIVEVFIVNFMIYTLSKKSINNTNYYIVSILLSVLTYVVRLLPIYYGVHIVINIITFISIMTILGIPLIKSIKNTLITFTILEFSEILNLIILIILDNKFWTDNEIYIKGSLGIPSLIFLFLSAVILKYRIKSE